MNIKEDENTNISGVAQIKSALITGITGQCGSYLAELLLDKGYKVYGFVPQTTFSETYHIDHLLKEDKIDLIHGDLSDSGSIFNAIQESKPDEIYNLGAQSHAGVSFKEIEHTMDVTGLAVGRILEAIRILNPSIKLFQASSSEFLGGELPWNEQSPIIANNPYGIAKATGHYLVEQYRKSYGIFAVNGIMFNMESPRRGENFVTRKITKAVADIVKGRRSELLLGNIEAKRDWGHAKEYMEGVYLMMQNSEPKDYVLATGESHSVREWMEAAFKSQNLDPYKYYKQDERFMRPSDIPEIRGDASLIKQDLGWEAQTKYDELVRLMVEADLNESTDS